jgi:ribosomal protein S18 acetylase RimI-like enzyme
VTVQVRVAGPEDRPVLLRFMAALQEYERALEANRTPGPEMAKPHLSHLEEEAAAHQGVMLIAEEEGKPLGFIAAMVDTDPGFFVAEKERRFGYIADIYVEEAARGTGAGQALMAAAEAHFKALGLTQVRLFAVAGNKSAQRFYEKSGYGLYEVSLRKYL